MQQKVYCAVCQNETDDHDETDCPSLKCKQCTRMGHGKPDCPFKPEKLWQLKQWTNFATKKSMPKLEVPPSKDDSKDPRMKVPLA